MQGRKVVEGAQREVFAAAQRSQRAQHNLSALMDQVAAKHQARYLSASVVDVTEYIFS
jgi:hypothetical protein